MTTFKRRAIKTKSVKPKNFARKPAKTSVPKDPNLAIAAKTGLHYGP